MHDRGFSVLGTEQYSKGHWRHYQIHCPHKCTVTGHDGYGQRNAGHDGPCRAADRGSKSSDDRCNAKKTEDAPNESEPTPQFLSLSDNPPHRLSSLLLAPSQEEGGTVTLNGRIRCHISN